MNHIRIFLLSWGWVCMGLSLQAQNVNCSGGTSSGPTTYVGSIFRNYGSVTNAINNKYSTTGSLGELFIGAAFGSEYQTAAGFYSRFLLPPSAPLVQATEGDLKDRIEINWVVDALSPSSELGFNIYRDGAFIGKVDKQIRKYVDFNVQAGVFYTYEVAGANPAGEGYRGSTLGFLNPNGVVTGQVKTINGNPVVGAGVTLTPSLGTALACSPDDQSFVEPNPALDAPQWTITCWVKQGENNFASYLLKKVPGQSSGLWMMAAGQNGGAKSLAIGVGDGIAPGYTFMLHELESDPDGWHHVALAFSGSSVLFYIDGKLIDSRPGTYQPATTQPLRMGAFDGGLDDVRIFNRQLSQTEINQYKNRTVNSDADGLVAYWKFDEGIGTKAYDISPNRLTMYLCGSEWTNDRPDVVNGAVTDDAGFYKIEGVNYGDGATFTAVPEKVSYNNYALEFNGAQQQYAVLPDSILMGAQTASIELRLNNFEISPATRTVLAKVPDDFSTANFKLFLTNGSLLVRVGSQVQNFGPLGTGYQHLVFTKVNNKISLYKNGNLAGSFDYSDASLITSGTEPWSLGASNSFSGYTEFFSGLIDEVAFYDTVLTQAQIQLHAAEGVSAQTQRLQSWFPLNESMGAVLEDIGLARTGNGTLQGATWSTVTGISDESVHEFQPNKRLVTLNSTSTSVDGVDFSDLSTVRVSGYARYDGTFCYADSVEILVNGQSYSPRIFTNSDGKFVADFEPGVTVRLSPKFKNHSFAPASWDVKNLNAPKAGILFRDITKRTVRIRLAGGDCRKSVLPQGYSAKIAVITLDECFADTAFLDHDNHPMGRYTFKNLPPVPLTVGVIDHDDPDVKDFFALSGGTQTDLSEKSDTLEFIYYAPPQVQIDSFSVNKCGFVQIPQYESALTNVRVYEDYYGEQCYLDTFLLTINNNIADEDQYDTLVTTGKHKLKVFGGAPNLTYPHEKVLQVTALVGGKSATRTLEAVVTGERPRASTFASTTPAFPLLILRDPPGDNSYAYIEKGQTFCKNWSLSTVKDIGGGQESRVSLGPKFDIGTGVGLWKSQEFDIVAETQEEFTVSRKQVSSTEQEVCLTTTEIISTSDQDDVVGDQGGDVYMGAAMNLIFGITDLVLLDTATCAFQLDTSFMIHPDGFETTYLYSEYFIKNTLIPNLQALKDTLSVNTWKSFITQNENYKKDAVFDRNLSFDAGVKYEYFFQKDSATTNSFNFDSTYTGEIIAKAGAFVGDLGAYVGAIFRLTTAETGSTDSTKSSTVKVGYVLDDDDAGDYFTVDIKNDKKYGTPVFHTRSGASSCPWEPKTQNREEVDLVVDKNVAVNVPENGAAVFTVILGNISQSAETRGYTLQLANGSNPNGAIVKVNGQPLTQGISYTVGFAVGQIVTVTVERGPIAYDYTGLELVWYSDCEVAHATATGLPIDPKFYKSVKLDVHFVQPCSPVDINDPQNGFVLTPQDPVVLPIRLVDYNENDANLKDISTQYRRANTNGAWINIAVTPRDSLDPVFERIFWNTTGLSDGDFEIRAVSACSTGLNPGISHVVQITIERSPPELLGLPEPADGVLSPGDEISITFNEEINCLKVFPADVLGNNTIGLYDTETGELIDATISCLGNKIVVVPAIANKFLEGKILRVEVDNIEDLAGNNFAGTEWEFFVNRSPLVLEGGNLDVTMYQGETQTIQRALRNIGGSIATYKVVGAPNWVKISPTTGSLQPGGEVQVSYKFESTLPQGIYRDTIYFENAQGDERVIINLRVLCPAPDWTFNPAAFPQTMTFQVQLDIEGAVSADEADIVAAFIDGELRGKANVEYVPAFNDYRAFLTVYGNDDEQDKPVDLVIWDASACLLYGQLVETFTYDIDGVVGSGVIPTILHTNSLVQRSIPLQTGWNWISFNLEFPDPALNSALGSLKYPENDLIKAQTSFAEYFGTDWIGSLTELGNTSMYQFLADKPDTIVMNGMLISPNTVQIPVVAGWNWLGYLPNQALPLDAALATLTPLNGDIVKSQTAFAQYVAGTGWIGSLKFMEAPKGYKLKISNAGSLVYPSNFKGNEVLEERGGAPVATNFWNVDPTQFEYSMTLVGMLSVNGQNGTADVHELGAFVGSELRGSAQAIYVEPLSSYLFFLTLYANAPGEDLVFKLYDNAAQEVKDLNEMIVFAADQHQGSVEAPVPFTLQTSGVSDQQSFEYFEVQPNPFSTSARLVFHSAAQQEVRLLISDALGRTVLHQKIDAVSGMNTFRLDGGVLSAGVYFVKLESASGSAVRKIICE
ncbi:MAG: T9SS type A sorting domain-containing protein [Lewinellaceae bacterium]|nr:T9SS type A sorting domain-containing protein [Lewinellaceae bacterium]